MTNFRTKSALILVALLAVAPASVSPASAATFSPLTCFAPSGVSVTDGGALMNTTANFVTVTCPIDKGGSGVVAFKWWLGFVDTSGMQTTCTYRRFSNDNPNVVDFSKSHRTFGDIPSLTGKGWLSDSATAAAHFYHDIKCSLAPGHSITALIY